MVEKYHIKGYQNLKLKESGEIDKLEGDKLIFF